MTEATGWYGLSSACIAISPLFSEAHLIVPCCLREFATSISGRICSQASTCTWQADDRCPVGPQPLYSTHTCFMVDLDFYNAQHRFDQWQSVTSHETKHTRQSRAYTDSSHGHTCLTVSFMFLTGVSQMHQST